MIIRTVLALFANKQISDIILLFLFYQAVKNIINFIQLV